MQLRLNLLMWNQTHALVLAEILIIKILNLKLVILLEYRNITIFLRKVHSNLVRRCFWDWKSLKYCAVDICCEWSWWQKIAGVFYEKELQKTNKKV